MDTAGQLKLLLWKDVLVRRRHLGVAGLVFGWAIAVFLILYIVRESVDTEYSVACQYKSRALPSTGLFPFLQSFVCNVDNKCGNLSQYEEMPRYKEARLTNLAQPLQSAFTNESILNVIKSLPEFIRLFKSVGTSLDTPDMEGLFGSGIPISEMFDDFDNVKLQLQTGSLMLDKKTIDDIFNASFKFGPVFKSLTSSDMGSTVCEPKELQKYLILNESYYINEVSSALCNISGKSVPSLLQNVIGHADFTRLLALLGKVSNQFNNYDVYEDISDLLDVVLNLDFIKSNIPPQLKLSQWLPKIVPLVKTMNRTYLDKEFVMKSLDIIEPYFNDTEEWPNTKNAILQILDSLIEFQNIIVNIIEKNNNNAVMSSESLSELITTMQNELLTVIEPYFHDAKEWPNIKNAIEQIFESLTEFQNVIVNNIENNNNHTVISPKSLSELISKMQNDLVTVIEPYFNGTKEWPNMKSAILQILESLTEFQNIIVNNIENKNNHTVISPKSFSELITKLQKDLVTVRNVSDLRIRSQQIAIDIASVGLNLAQQLYLNSTNTWLKIANTLDSVTHFLDKKSKDEINVITFFYIEGVLTLNDIIRNYFESEDIIYDISQKHSDVVSTLFSLGPEFISSMLKCFSNVTCTTILIQNKNNISNIFCHSKYENMFPSSIKNINSLCNVNVNSFMDDVIEKFNFDQINGTVLRSDKVISELNYENIGNLSQAVIYTENLINYVVNKTKTSDNKQISWEHIIPSVENPQWKKIVSEANNNKGLYLMNIRLCYFKEVLGNNTELDRHLNIILQFMRGFVDEYRLLQPLFRQTILSNLPTIVDATIRLWTNRTQVSALISELDWFRYFCKSDLLDENGKGMTKILCEQMMILDEITMRVPWSAHPILASLYPDDGNVHLRDFNWNRFITTAQNFYLTIEDIVNLQIPDIKWHELKAFQPAFWKNWIRGLSVEEEIQIGIKILLRILSYTDMIVFYTGTEAQGRLLLTSYRGVAHITVFVNDIVDFAIIANNSKSYKLDNHYPKTYNLAKTVTQSLGDIMLDFNMWLSQDGDVSDLVEWFKYPCAKNITTILSTFSVQSKRGLSALQHAVCNSTEYDAEWQSDRLTMETYENLGPEWAVAVERFAKVIRDVRNIEKHPNDTNIGGSWNSIRDDLSNNYNRGGFYKLLIKIVDKELENKVLRQETLSQLWKELRECQKSNDSGNCSQIQSDFARYTSKFIATGLSEVTSTIRQYIRTINATSGVDPIILLGFSNTSAVYNLYANFADYMKVFVHSYRSKEFEMKILEKRTKGTSIRCQDIINYLTIPENNSVTAKDLHEIGRYFCPSFFDWPVLQDNLFLAVVTKLQDMYLDTPVAKFQVSYATAYDNLMNTIRDITSMLNHRVHIRKLWNKTWINKMQQAFLELKELNFTSENTITRLFKYVDIPQNDFINGEHLISSKFGFGDFTFVLNHMTQSLQNFESLNFTTTDLSTNEDIETFRDMIAYYPNQLAGILSYAYFRDNDTGNWRNLRMFCISGETSELDLYLPMWMRIDEEKIVDNLCKINFFGSISDDTFSDDELTSVKNYNVNLEESILNFISSLISIENNNFTIHVSSLVSDQLDLGAILNGTFPSDEELRNSSFQKAADLIYIPWNGHLKELDALLQFNTVLFKILQGGDWWNYLINIVKDPVLKVWLHIIERMPHIVLHLAEAAITPHFLYDALQSSHARGPFFVCKSDLKIDDDNIFGVIRSACNATRIEPEIFDIEYNDTEKIRTRNVNKFAEHIYDFEKNLIDLIKTGPKKFDVPKWLNETMILQEYKNFATKNTQPLTLLQTVTNIMNEIVDIGEYFYRSSFESSCPWCTWATILVKEVSRHLTFSSKYVDFLCNVPKMNVTEIRTTLVDDFKWGSFYKDLTSDRKYSVDEFNRELHDVVEVIRMQLITFYTNKTLRALPGQCLKNIGNSPALKNITTYVTAISEIVKFVRTSSMQFLNTSSLNTSQYFMQGIEKDIPIWISHNIILYSNISDDEFFQSYFSTPTIYTNPSVNVNELVKIKEPNDLKKYFADLILFEKLILPSTLFKPGISTSELNTLSHKYFNYVKWDTLKNNIDVWRKDSMRSFKWLGDIYDSLENVILNGGNLLDFLSTIDFSALTSGTFNISNLLTGILDILHKNSIEKLFESLHQFINSLSPIIRMTSVVQDIHTLLNAIENMTIFQNIGFLRTKYNISDLVSNWTTVREYLIEEINLDELVVDQILNASIDLFTIISTQKDLLNTKDLLCNPEELKKLISFRNGDPEEITNQVSIQLCSMKMDDLQKIAIMMLKNLNFSHVLNNVMESSVKNILTSANMTEEDGKQVLKNIGAGVQLLPFFKSMISNISTQFNDMPKFDSLKSTSTENSKVVSPGLLSAGSDMLCGRRLSQQSGKLYKTIAKAKDFNAKKFDIAEQESLPTQFCRNLYEDIVHMDAGKVIWSYMKPLIRGRILFTPDVPAVRSIIQHANTTFASIAHLEEIFFKMTDSLSALDNREEIKHILENIMGLLNSSIVRGIIQEAISSSAHGPKISLDKLNLTDMLGNLGDSKRINSALKFGTDILKCVLLDRFVPVGSETELEQKAKHLMRSNEFIAGLVFLNVDHRSKRSTDIPHNISYKIRMDIDSVPSTSYLKYKFWTPGPDGDFLNDMRYFRGFIQLQDLIDNAIIRLKSSDKLSEINVVTQQMPYPCWTNDFFKSALAISQTFQVCFFFGLIVVVASSVRYVVWEKESGNTMVMNVMGLRYLIHCTSWFVVTLIEMLIIMISIFIIIKAGGILPMSSGSLLFLYLLDFGFSVIMFCYMISSIFDSASLAAVGSAIFYLISYMPYIIIISLETTMSTWLKVLTNFSMSSSFSYGCLYMIRYELQGVGIQWHNAWDTPILGDSMSFGMTCIFIAFDGILYGAIGYLCSRRTIETDSYVTYDNELFMGANISGDNYLDDTVSSNIVNDEPLKIGVTIKGLTKIYNTRKQTVKAIENIDITLHIGQVTTLLGHNGAGKTTLIKILTGMMPPTSGQIIINSEISDNDIKTSKYLGVCPQGSVLINTMTAMEHLIFYAKLKTGRNTMQVMPEVVEMTDSLGLGLLSNEPVANLSEGMRRRLCVAIAFIGKPKLVVLDEPSSGVDPVARRQIWDLVVRYKEGCTVLLTTHHLDEAELLSDRVVVLHKGKVLCSGSPLILKQSYGKGYKVQVTYPPSKEVDAEVSTNNVNTLLSTVRKEASNADHFETKVSEVTVIVPFNSSAGIANNFEDVASILEENQAELGFSTFAMNCTTLEEVFLDLCANEDEKLGELPLKTNSVSQIGQSYNNIFGHSVDDLAILKDDEVLVDTGEKLTGSDFSKFLALMKKRAIHCMFDWRVIICALILPALFTAVAMGFSLIRPPNSYEPALKLSPELYMPDTTAFISVDTNNSNSFASRASREFVSLTQFNKFGVFSGKSRDCECTDGMQTCSKPSETTYDNTLLKLPSSKEIVDWVVETQDEYIERRYGGWSLTDESDNKTTLVVWYNNKGYHSMPSYLNTMNSAILRTVSPGSVINTYNHPLKLSVDQLSKSSIAQHIADVGIAMVLLLAFSLVPASGAIYLVQERVNEEKRLQYLCGVSPTLYWIVAFIWDMIILVCALILAIIVFKIFGLPVYVARENMAAVSLLIFLYGWACIPLIHLLQRWFNDASMANMVLFCGCAFVGISELTCILLMDILGTTQFAADFRQILHKIYLIFPQFVLGDGLVEISKNNIQSEILQRFHMDTYVSPLSWDLMGLHYLSLALIGTILFFFNLLIENKWFKSIKHSSSIQPSDTWCVETVNLTKEYKTVSGKHNAVNDVTLRVPFGQCLGLIGVNGAGKSTTFKMLTTEIQPTSGKIFLQGREIGEKPLYTGEMGYCSQSDSLDPKLTVRQTLVTYLTLRGTENPNQIVSKIMHKFELDGYANRKTENLSGGNRRKLCAALSVLGRTSLILMDEPTSGMDPYSRNLVAQIIQQLIRRNRSVILTSHSVEDCEALCSQVAVMINGKVICQGSPQDLKDRYGSGYIISVRLLKSTEQDSLLSIMQKEFPGAELMSRQYCSSQFSVPTEHIRVSEMFRKMSKISEYVAVEDFNLVQSSLDQVFINLANKSNELHNSNLDDSLKYTLPNMYSMDVL